jgi:hypothetical protein
MLLAPIGTTGLAADATACGKRRVCPRVLPAEDGRRRRPPAGPALKAVEKLLTTILTSPDTTERNPSGAGQQAGIPLHQPRPLLAWSLLLAWTPRHPAQAPPQLHGHALDHRPGAVSSRPGPKCPGRQPRWLVWTPQRPTRVSARRPRYPLGRARGVQPDRVGCPLGQVRESAAGPVRGRSGRWPRSAVTRTCNHRSPLDQPQLPAGKT